MKIAESDENAQAVAEGISREWTLGKRGGVSTLGLSAIRAINRLMTEGEGDSLPCPATNQAGADAGEARNAALEEAAKVCDEREALRRHERDNQERNIADRRRRGHAVEPEMQWLADKFDLCKMEAEFLARSIRALKALPSPSGGRQGGGESNDSSPLLVPTQPQGPATPTGETMHERYAAAREAMNAHAADCYFCKPPSHTSQGCAEGQRLYEACRDSLRARNATPPPPDATPGTTGEATSRTPTEVVGWLSAVGHQDLSKASSPTPTERDMAAADALIGESITIRGTTGDGGQPGELASSLFTSLQIAAARADGRLRVDADGYGWIRDMEPAPPAAPGTTPRPCASWCCPTDRCLIGDKCGDGDPPRTGEPKQGGWGASVKLDAGDMAIAAASTWTTGEATCAECARGTIHYPCPSSPIPTDATKGETCGPCHGSGKRCASCARGRQACICDHFAPADCPTCKGTGSKPSTTGEP